MNHIKVSAGYGTHTERSDIGLSASGGDVDAFWTMPPGMSGCKFK